MGPDLAISLGRQERLGAPEPFGWQFLDIVGFGRQVERHQSQTLGKVPVFALFGQTGTDAGLSPEINCPNHDISPHATSN